MKRNGTVNRAMPALGLAALAALMSVAVPAWSAPPDCAAAKKTFASNCIACHMADGKGNAILKSPDFTDPKWQAAHKNRELIAAIMNGVKGTAMPSWKSQLKPAEIDALLSCVVRGFGKQTSSAKHAVAKAPKTTPKK